MADWAWSKCCASNCCSDSRVEDEALAHMRAPPQMQRPTAEPMPIPEEEDDPIAPPQASELATVPTPVRKSSELEIIGSTSSIGVRYTIEADSTLKQQIGLDFEVLDSSTCLVSHVKRDGQAAEWNEKMGIKDQVRRYDCLRTVNGETAGTAKDMVRLVTAVKGPVVFTLERPTVIELTVRRHGAKLGLGVAASKSNLGLLVRGVEPEGAIAKTNLAADVDYVAPGDRIVAVDGEYLPPSEIAKGLARDEYRLTIYRYLPA